MSHDDKATLFSLESRTSTSKPMAFLPSPLHHQTAPYSRGLTFQTVSAQRSDNTEAPIQKNEMWATV